MTAEPATLQPSAFCRHLLEALEASEGRSRKRKRDQSPDRIGLELRRELLERVVAEDPAPEAFEGWLLEQVLASPFPGPIRALCIQIKEEYRLMALDPRFAEWLAAGAPSDDAEQRRRRDGDRECGCPPWVPHHA